MDWPHKMKEQNNECNQGPQGRVRAQTMRCCSKATQHIPKKNNKTLNKKKHKNYKKTYKKTTKHKHIKKNSSTKRRRKTNPKMYKKQPCKKT